MHHIVTYGGWYQRTTLHLSEIYEFFFSGKSSIDGLNPEQLSRLYQQLDLASVSRETSYLEYVQAKTKQGISVRYYEDGLYILQITASEVSDASDILQDYFEKQFGPAISYLFSKGAPTPKVLANIKTSHSTVIGLISANPAKEKIDENVYGQIYSQITSAQITVYKTPNHIFVAATDKYNQVVADIIEVQIFFREFKDQLEKYLQIHRRIWEEISAIKEQKSIPGSQIRHIRSQLDGYQKTINLISNRINQMGTYISTRASIAKQLDLEDYLKTLFQYKFETLADTLGYIKEIWSMTKEYLASAIQIMVEVENQSLNTSLRSLQILTSIGVVSGVLGLLARQEWLKVTSYGFLYFLILIAISWLVNAIISLVFARLKYRLKFTERSQNL